MQATHVGVAERGRVKRQPFVEQRGGPHTGSCKAPRNDYAYEAGTTRTGTVVEHNTR